MKCENKLYSSWWKLLLVLFVIGNTACSGEKYVYEAYTKIFERVLDSDYKKISGAQAGRLLGKAQFHYSLKNKTITVDYGFIPVDNYIQNLLLEKYEWATEVGSLSSLTIKDHCGFVDENRYYPVSIQGRWTPVGTGSGDLVIALSKDNELNVYIFGEGNWKYWSSYKLSSSDGKYVLDVLNDALARSQGKERVSLDNYNEDALYGNGIVGYWRGEDGSMIYIPSEKVKDSEGRLVYRSFFFYKQLFFDEDHSYCEYNNLYYEGLDEGGNHIYNMDNGHEGGTLLFNESNQTLSLYFQFHKDPSIAAQLGQIKAEFDAKNNANQSRAAKKIAENPWILGRWGMGGSVVAVIKNNGIAVVYGTEVVIRISADGKKGYFEEGGEVYTIDWAKRTIVFMEDEPLQKIDK